MPWSAAVLDYFASRAIAPDVATELGVRENRGELEFPYPNGSAEQFSRTRSLNGAGPKVSQPRGTRLCPWHPVPNGKTREMLVTEGESDALAALSALRQAPLKDLRGLRVAGVPGTGCPAERVVEHLVDANCRQAWLALDADKAGRHFTQALIPELVAVGIKPFVVELPDGCDLADCLAAEEEGDRGEWIASALVDAEAAGVEPIHELAPVDHAAIGDSWPEPMHEDAFHGLAGEIVGAIEPHTEADPAAILVQFLAAVGSAVGRGPGWTVEATRHHCNLYVDGRPRLE
jgi:hypothetical protein